MDRGKSTAESGRLARCERDARSPAHGNKFASRGLMRQWGLPIAIAAAFLSCGKPVEKHAEVAVPIGRPDNARTRLVERFDLAWRQLESFRAQQAARQAQQPGTEPAPPQPMQFVSGVKESFKHLDMTAINSAPVNVPITGDQTGPSVLKAQVYLDRVHFSVGAIDGGWGKNSSIA